MLWLRTVVQGALQDGRGAGTAVPDPREGQHLDLVEDVLAQRAELDAVAGVALHRPRLGGSVRVLLLVDHLEGTSH